ncbi:unnamed protein product [Closterium sp. Naga37s-1]|nr:unnamed protein product [Closterium sp. Naga37s-1]
MASRPLETDDHDAATTNRNGSNVGIETGRRGEAEEVRGKKGGGVSEQEEKAQQQQDEEKLGGEEEETGVRHILFNIASSNASFSKRVRYLRAWWRSGNHADSASSESDAPLRGYVWMDDVARFSKALRCGVGGTPPVRVSSSTAHLSYRGVALRDYVRMARVVVDAYRLGEKNVRWYVMGDDDTFFSPHALAAFLQQYDHRALLYLGSTSETHMQNVDFTRTMAFGGAGFAVSAALARALSAGDGMDPCLERHAKLRGSDERVAACIGELGVSLTVAPGFHQCDLHHSLFGLLMSHPAQPLLSLHHFDTVDPILKPVGIKNRAQGLATLAKLIRPDPVGFAQLAVCGDGANWTAAISWGFAIKIYPGERQLSELERAERTFESYRWNKHAHAFNFDTRRWEPDAPAYRPCALPFTLYATHGYEQRERQRADACGECVQPHTTRKHRTRPLPLPSFDLQSDNSIRDQARRAYADRKWC